MSDAPLTQADEREPLSEWLRRRGKLPTITDLQVFEARLVEVERERDAKHFSDEEFQAKCNELLSAVLQAEEYREALKDALEGLREMLPYVPEYFVEKHDLGAYAGRIEDALNPSSGASGMLSSHPKGETT